MTAALEVARRLEHSNSIPLAERYFPELALAWQTVERLRDTTGSRPSANPALSDYDCIAVDECQDLKPIEAWLIVELASRARGKRRAVLSLLMAGDEAQTVRPTDFEWGWLSDLLHAQVGTPTNYKLSANLRSPRRVATLVNRVWDLYSHVEKQERPSGSGYAEIEDDATDQILYCGHSRPRAGRKLRGFCGPETSSYALWYASTEGHQKFQKYAEKFEGTFQVNKGPI